MCPRTLATSNELTLADVERLSPGLLVPTDRDSAPGGGSNRILGTEETYDA
jgi:hypothetical protein